VVSFFCADDINVMNNDNTMAGMFFCSIIKKFAYRCPEKENCIKVRKKLPEHHLPVGIKFNQNENEYSKSK